MFEKINSFAISSLMIILGNSLMAMISFRDSHGRNPNILWGYFCLLCVVWGIGGYKFSTTTSYDLAFFWWQVAYFSAILVPVVFFHFVVEFLKLKQKHGKFLRYLYAIAFFFLFMNFFSREAFLGELRFVFNEFFCFDWTRKKSLIFLLFYLGFYWFLLLYSFILLLLNYKSSVGIKRNQLKYFIVGCMIGFLGPHLFFPVAFRVDIYPFSNFLIAVYPIIIGYAILKYRLMEITLAITRTGIFIAVYSIVLGIPFALAFGWRGQLQNLMGETWWLAPLVSSTILATVGPFIYLYIQRKAEDRLLREQRQYQATLRRASLGMGRVKDLNRLLKLTVNIITRNVQIEHAAIYLTHPPSGRYVLKALKGREVATRKHMFIPGDSPLVTYLKRYREPLVYDELKQRSQDFQDKNLVEVCQTIEELHGALLIPSFIEEDLIAIVVLGNKKSGKLYSHDDLVVFSILANQAALGIENAQFYEEMKKTHEQLMKAEKMATIGTMADGLSHQINNRLHAMGFITGDLLDTIKLKRTDNMPPETKALLDEAEHSLGRIQDNVKRGGEIVEGLLKYSRKADEGLTAVDLNKLLDAAIEMAQFKIKINQIDIIRDFSPSLSKIRGNFTQLQEVFFNMIDNAYDAMMERKEGMKEPAYRGRLEISAKEDGNNLEILLRDNGIGVKDKDFKRLFTPFFTTKITSKKGTGLGLYVIRKIIEENHGGKVEFTSEYQRGSQTRLLLPAFCVQS